MNDISEMPSILSLTSRSELVTSKPSLQKWQSCLMLCLEQNGSTSLSLFSMESTQYQALPAKVGELAKIKCEP